MNNASAITIVSGLPRSGTSLMMQMLTAGGIEPLTDNVRQPDEDNPRGYLEFEKVKQIKKDQSWLPDAQGKVVKLVHLLLLDLPSNYSYNIVFMRRRIEEVLASQQKMLARSGKGGAQIAAAVLTKTFEQQLGKVSNWVQTQPNIRMTEVWYHELIADPTGNIAKINQFLGGTLDEAKMAAAVDPSLYRNRS